MEYLRRYTDITALTYLLTERKITLLDPQSWDDKNDSQYLSFYREKKCLKTVLALCFSQGTETYHHWRVFAPGSGGICISFNKQELVKYLSKNENLQMKPVTYLTLKAIRNKSLTVDQLPFVKRYAFHHENEFRIIYNSQSKKYKKLDIDIKLSLIERIILSPWMNPDLFTSIKDTLRKINGCSKLKISLSTLINNQEWKDLGEAAVEKIEKIQGNRKKILKFELKGGLFKGI